MEERTHGGDIYGLERPVLDLSISLNPLGVPPCAIQPAHRTRPESRQAGGAGGAGALSRLS